MSVKDVKKMNRIATIEEAEKYVTDRLEFALERLKEEGDVAKTHRSVYGAALMRMKRRIHPARTCPETRAVLDRAEAEGGNLGPEVAASYVKRCQELKETAEGKRYERLCSTIDQAWAPIGRLDDGIGRSNRARRAKRASDVFSRHAGLNKIEGAKVDVDGNALGDEFDLGVAGAYDGLRVVILQLYVRGHFTMREPIEALRSKGFEVDHFKTDSADPIPAPFHLDLLLEEASQVWVISGKYGDLKDEHIDVIVKHWRTGLGVYVFGDNDPFYADANPLLRAMGLGIKMEGNYSGKQTVGARTGSRPGGFLPHLVTTGLVRLFEGITVAEIIPDESDRDANRRKTLDGKKSSWNALDGFAEILREHSGPLTVVAREAEDGCGPVIVDGAFTKLYCHWNFGGSARFVKNCACWLSSDSGVIEDEPEAKEENKEEVELDLEGCLRGECAITMEDDVPLAILATSMPDREANTTDFALDNNLALGRRNMVLCGQPLALETAKIFLEQGEDPFSRREVTCVIPLADLSKEANLKIVTGLANDLFMGGRRMCRHSRNILLSVCEEMLQRDPESEAFRFLVKQLLHNAVSTPDMLKGVWGGLTVPLIQGLATNITLTGDLVPLRKAFAHVGRIIRLLKLHQEDSKVDDQTLRRVARRSLIKVLTGAGIRAAKQDDYREYGETLMKNLKGVMFGEVVHGIPITGTAKHVRMEDLRPIVAAGIKHCTPEELESDAKRTAESLKLDGLLGEDELTEIALALWSRGRNGAREWQVLIEPLLKRLFENPHFKAMWDDVPRAEDKPKSKAKKSKKKRRKAQEEGSSSDKATGVLRRVEDCLTGRFVTEPVKHDSYPWPGFVSPFGPSCFRCKCGFEFGDPEDVCLDFDRLKRRRNKHFKEMFGGDSVNGYPTKTSVHFPLHRAVQRVLTREEFRTASCVSVFMEKAVADYLRKKKKGNIHCKTLLSDIRFALQTYLDCRAKGMEEPGPEESVEFKKKARIEQALILESRKRGGPRWVEPRR